LENGIIRAFHRDYLVGKTIAPNEVIATTDDFLCQECTAWSRLGAIDLLASVIDLPDDSRAVLRGWHERHAAISGSAESRPTEATRNCSRR